MRLVTANCIFAEPRMFLVFLLFSVACIGCEHRLDFEQPLAEFSPIEAMPISVGLYYTPNFRTYEWYLSGFGHNFKVGESSVPLFDQLTKKMFREVVLIEDEPIFDQAGLRADVLVSLDIEDFYFTFYAREPTEIVDRARVRYRVRLYSQDGDELISWATVGEGINRGLALNIPRARLGMTKTLKNAASNFYADFRDYFAGYAPLFARASSRAS